MFKDNKIFFVICLVVILAVGFVSTFDFVNIQDQEVVSGERLCAGYVNTIPNNSVVFHAGSGSYVKFSNLYLKNSENTYLQTCSDSQFNNTIKEANHEGKHVFLIGNKNNTVIEKIQHQGFNVTHINKQIYEIK